MILSIPSIEFWIGEYCLDAFTYPAWCSLVLQLFSLLVNIIFLRHVEDESTNQGIQPDVEEGKGLLFWSPGVLLLMVLFFFDGLLLSSIVYALPIVMIDGYGWSILQYAPVWLGISIMGIAGVQVAKYFGKWLKSYYFALVAPSLAYIGLMCILAKVSIPGMESTPALGESLFLVSAETNFLAYQLLQTVLSSLFTQIVPVEYIVSASPPIALVMRASFSL